MWLTAPRPGVPLQHERCRKRYPGSNACQRAPPPCALLSFLEKTHPRIETIDAGEQLSCIVDPSVNIVWWPRSLHNDMQRALPQALEQAGIFKHSAVVDDQSTINMVTSLFPRGPLRALLAADAASVVRCYLAALGTHALCINCCWMTTRYTGMQRALVKLETVTKTTCSRWHADHVAVRGLVTYVGAGTEFVANQYVDRKQLLLNLGVQDTGGYALRRGATVQQARSGDVLLLKGHAYEGFDGTCVRTMS